MENKMYLVVLSCIRKLKEDGVEVFHDDYIGVCRTEELCEVAVKKWMADHPEAKLEGNDRGEGGKIFDIENDDAVRYIEYVEDTDEFVVDNFTVFVEAVDLFE